MERNDAGFRTVPGMVLENNFSQTVYTPPDPDAVPAMSSRILRMRLAICSRERHSCLCRRQQL